MLINLLRSIEIKDTEKVREILKKLPELLNQVNSKGFSPLWKALLDGHEEVVELLITEFGADPDEKCCCQNVTYEGSTYLQYAAGSDYSLSKSKIAEILIKHGASVNLNAPTMLDLKDGYPLLISLINNNLKFAELLKKNGAKFDGKFRNQNGENLLHIFIKCAGEHVDAVKITEILINDGVLLDEFDNDGFVPLHRAVEKSNIDLTSFLIKKGADVNIKSPKYGFFPLFLAVTTGNDNLVNLLLSHGAEVNAKTNFGGTALHQACINNEEKTISLLLQKGANVNVKDNNGSTPFSFMIDDQPQVIFHGGYRYAPMINIEPIAPMLKEFAKLIFEDKPVFKEDLDLILVNSEVREYFEQCKCEILLMANTTFYHSYTYYSVLKMSKNMVKLANLITNKEFVAAYEKNLSFSCYNNDLLKILNQAIKARDEAAVVYSRLNSVLKNFLPELVIEKLRDNLTIKDLPLD